MRGKIAVWEKVAWSLGAQMIWCAAVTQDYAAEPFKLKW
jgi:hypothetical protein